VLVRFAYLAVTHAFAALRLLPMTHREKDIEILALRHQLTILQRQISDQRPQLRPEDRAFLAALLVPLSRATLRRLRLLVSPDTVLRWHRDLVKHRHTRASMRREPGRPRTVASIRRLVLRLAAENPSWGYRRIHGELALSGVTITPSTVWEILKTEGIDPAPQRATVTWAAFLRSQAEAILAMDFIDGKEFFRNETTTKGPFLLQGVPALDLWVDMSKYFEVHHKASDTMDKVDALDFKAGEAIVAVTAYAIAQTQKPIAPHVDHKAVGEILKDAKLDELLEHVGVWKP